MNFVKRRTDDESGGPMEFTPISWNSIAMSIFDHERSKNLENLLSRCEWKTFTESEELGKKISKKKDDLTRIENSPKSKEELQAECEADYVAHCEKRTAVLSRVYGSRKSRWISGVGSDPINAEAFSVLSVYVSKDEHMRAKASIEAEPNAMGERDKRETAGKLRREISALQEEKKRLDGPEFFDSTVDHMDCRKLLVMRWIETQRQIKKACNCIGVDLKLCSPNQQAAHSILGLARYINKDGKAPCSYRA